MKNQARHLTAMIFVLVSLVGAYYGLQAYTASLEEKAAARAEALEAELTLYETEKEDITAFSYTYEGEIYEYVKEDGIWYYAGDRTMNLDQDDIDTFLGAFVSIEVAEDLGEMQYLEPYGLDADYVTVTWTTDAGTVELHIGDYNETVGEYYMNVAGESRVYLQESYFQARFKKTPDYFEAEEEVEEAETEGSETEETAAETEEVTETVTTE